MRGIAPFQFRFRKPILDVRCWVDDIPRGWMVRTQENAIKFDATGVPAVSERKITIELNFVAGIPRFALIGGCFIPDTSQSFKLYLPETSMLDDIDFGEGPDQRPGLPEEYRDAVINGLTGRKGFNESLALPSGQFYIKTAGHHVAYSAPVVFLRAARSLYRCLMLDTLSSESLSDLRLYEWLDRLFPETVV